jgi:hypothetical protein
MPKMFEMFNGVPYILIDINNITPLLHSIHYLNCFFLLSDLQALSGGIGCSTTRTCARRGCEADWTLTDWSLSWPAALCTTIRPSVGSLSRYSSVFLMNQRPILCTFHIAVDFLIVPYKGLYRGGGGGE